MCLQTGSKDSDQPAHLHRLISLRWTHMQSCEKSCVPVQLLIVLLVFFMVQNSPAIVHGGFLYRFVPK